MTKHLLVISITFLFTESVLAQNLVNGGYITNSNAIWGGGASESPHNATTYENAYLTGGCNTNYVMEVDNASNPSQVVNGFVAGAQYTITFRYAYRTSCAPSVNPTNLRVRFSDAVAVLDQTISVNNTMTTLTNQFSYTFTNDAAASHTLVFTNPGNTATCGVVVDDIAIVRVVSPGGVGTGNVAVWFKASNIGNVDGATVQSWVSTGNNVITVRPPCANQPVYRTGLVTAANNLVANFNPYIVFNGTNQYLANALARFDLVNLAVAGASSSFAVHQGGSATRTYFGHRANTASMGRIWMNTSQVQYGNNTGNGDLAAYTRNTRNNIIAFRGIASSMNLRDQNGNSFNAVASTSDVDYLTIGARRVGAGTVDQYYDGSLSEIILFNATLSNTLMQQVRSYLATKYGVTLSDNSTTAGIDERDYIATNGTTTYWSYSVNSTFHNNVTIIGRDDNTSLDQRRSISTDLDLNAMAAMTGNSMLTIDNVAAISTDISYLAAGHNGLGTNVNDIVDIPTGIQSRMARFWKYQKTGTGISNNVTLTFNMSGFSPLNGSDLRLLVSTTNSFGTATTTIITGSYVAPNFTVSLPTTGGVFFTVGSINVITSPLPIELLTFEATPNNNQVDLNWITASESNNDYFTIEKTKDGFTIETLLHVEGVGNSNTNINYSAVDYFPYNGISYYRLKQTDFNGDYTYSNWVAVDFKSTAGFDMTIFPNPHEGSEIYLRFDLDENEIIDIDLTDISGKIIYSTQSLISDQGIVSIPLQEILSSGMYFVNARYGDKKLSKKLIVGN